VAGFCTQSITTEGIEMSIRKQIQQRHDDRFGVDFNNANQLLRVLEDRRILLDILDELAFLVNENVLTTKDVEEILERDHK
jgi:ATP:corrinoid adenosyltransferase